MNILSVFWTVVLAWIFAADCGESGGVTCEVDWVTVELSLLAVFAIGLVGAGIFFAGKRSKIKGRVWKVVRMNGSAAASSSSVADTDTAIENIPMADAVVAVDVEDLQLSSAVAEAVPVNDNNNNDDNASNEDDTSTPEAKVLELV